ncbi:MAG: peptide deformylase [Bacteroidales bacterium]|jgi:peptide deformylase|nr:peptide deformylase [Bacteroidales bacterium]
MKTYNLIFVLICFGICLVGTACSSKMYFSEEEKMLINSGNSHEQMRVLLTTNLDDLLVLRTVCSDIDLSQRDSLLDKLILRMKITMENEGGIGIAASQVGVLKNIFLFTRLSVPNQPVEVAINPRIIAHSDSSICFVGDRCLSIPDVSGNSLRYAWIEVEYFDESGTKVRCCLSDVSRQSTFTAIIFQHEYDHTKGVLFIDKLCK